VSSDALNAILNPMAASGCGPITISYSPTVLPTWLTYDQITKKFTILSST